MSDSRRKVTSGLGRGLSNLLGEDIKETNTDLSNLDHRMVNIDLLDPSPYQPRRTFDEEALNSLINSVKEKGVLQPLLVRKDKKNNQRYEIIAGERRFRASQLAGVSEVPVIIKEMNDKEVLEVALIENIQRQDLNAIEEAEGYSRLIEEFDHTQEELSKIIGKSRSHVANTMRLLNLPLKVRSMVVDKKLSAGHARALVTAKNPEELADVIVSKGLNVRQAEKLIYSFENKKEKSSVNKKEELTDSKILSNEVEKVLGTKVSIKFKNNGGDIILNFDSLGVLDVILKRLTKGGSLLDPFSLDMMEDEYTEDLNDEE